MKRWLKTPVTVHSGWLLVLLILLVMGLAPESWLAVQGFCFVAVVVIVLMGFL